MVIFTVTEEEYAGFQKDASELHPAVIKLGLQYASGMHR